MLPAGFETATPAKERPQTYVLDGAVTGVSRNQMAGRNLITATLKVLISFGEIVESNNRENLPERDALRTQPPALEQTENVR